MKTIIKKAPSSYESYLYKYLRTDIDKAYVGSRKGTYGDGYTHSSTCEQFAEDLKNPNIPWAFEVFAYGSHEEIKHLEYETLTEANAATSEDWYNKHNGFPSKVISKQTDVNVIQEIVERINSKEFNKGLTRSTELLVKAPRIQVRKIDANQTTLADRFKAKNGIIDDGLCDPVTILEGRGANGEDVILDGNTTIGAASDSKVVPELPIQVIPYNVHKDLNDKELVWIGTALNKESEKVIHSMTVEDLVKQILEEAVDENDAKSQRIRDLLKLSGKASGVITKAINAAAEKIREKYWKSQNKTLINWESGRWKPVLEAKVEAAKDANTVAYDIASGMISISKAFQPFLDQVLPVGTTKLKKKNLVIFLKHNMTNRDMKAEWDLKKDYVMHNLDFIAKKSGFKYKIIELDVAEKSYKSQNLVSA